MVCGGSFQHTVQLESDFKTRLSRFWALRATTNAGGMANRLSATGAVDFPAGLEAFLLRAMRYGGQVASAAVKSPSPPFGFRHAAGHEMRPSPHANTPLRGYAKATGNVCAPCCWHSYGQHDCLGVVQKQLLHLFATLQLFTNTNGRDATIHTPFREARSAGVFACREGGVRVRRQEAAPPGAMRCGARGEMTISSPGAAYRIKVAKQPASQPTGSWSRVAQESPRRF